MNIKYTILENDYIYMEKNGLFFTIPNDPANSDYQTYLESLNETTSK